MQYYPACKRKIEENSPETRTKSCLSKIEKVGLLKKRRSQLIRTALEIVPDNVKLNKIQIKKTFVIANLCCVMPSRKILAVDFTSFALGKG